MDIPKFYEFDTGVYDVVGFRELLDLHNPDASRFLLALRRRTKGYGDSWEGAFPLVVAADGTPDEKSWKTCHDSMQAVWEAVGPVGSWPVGFQSEESHQNAREHLVVIRQELARLANA